MSSVVNRGGNVGAANLLILTITGMNVADSVTQLQTPSSNVPSWS